MEQENRSDNAGRDQAAGGHRATRKEISPVRLALTVCVTLGVAWVLAACGSSETVDPDRSPSFEQIAPGTVDYEPVESPAELVGLTERYLDRVDIHESDEVAVISGEVIGIRPGRMYGVDEIGTDPGGQMPTMVMEIEVCERIAGDLAGNFDGSVYVELMGGDPEDLGDAIDATEARIPEGTPALAYLLRAPTEGAIPPIGRKHRDRGLPEGQTLYQVAHPQGFYLYDQDAAVVIRPYDYLQYPDRTLTDFTPGTGVFPEGEPRGPCDRT